MAASTASARVLHFQITIVVSGPGHVTGNGDGGSFDCPDQCSALIRQNTSITLTATPDGGATFEGWGGSCGDSGSDPTCTLSVTGPKDVTAGFGTPPPPPSRFSLSVSKTGTGSGFVGGAGGIDCGPTCSASFGQGAQVTLLAVADDGSTFGGWSGAGCSGTGMCTVTTTSDTTVAARFDHVDRVPPNIRTLPAAAAPGTTALLRFRVYDDSGKSRELLTILQGSVTIGHVIVPLSHVQYRHVYTAAWHVPHGLKPGARRYCAVAIDEAGNRSTRSCSLFTVT